jgi:hypothetical protein
MRRSTAAVAVLAALQAVALAPGRSSAAPPADSKRDSGHYGLSATCSSDQKWLSCTVSIRDLVYDTVVLPEQQLKATLDGTLGGAVQVTTNPALGQPQQIGIALNLADGTASFPLARVTVQVHEAEHLVQEYSVRFPVVRQGS